MKLFLFTSSVLNEERNAALFESVLTTQHSLQLQDDPLAEELANVNQDWAMRLHKPPIDNKSH